MWLGGLCLTALSYDETVNTNDGYLDQAVPADSLACLIIDLLYQI